MMDLTVIMMMTADLESISLQFKVDRGIVVPDVGHVLNARNLLGDHVGVLHGHQGGRDTHQV